MDRSSSSAGQGDKTRQDIIGKEAFNTNEENEIVRWTESLSTT